jgi:hypothetical protein
MHGFVVLQGLAMQQQQQGPFPVTLMHRVDMLLAGDSEKLRGKAAIAVASLDAEQRGSYLQMPDTLLRDALKQLAQQSGGALSDHFTMHRQSRS